MPETDLDAGTATAADMRTGQATAPTRTAIRRDLSWADVVIDLDTDALTPLPAQIPAPVRTLREQTFTQVRTTSLYAIPDSSQPVSKIVFHLHVANGPSIAVAYQQTLPALTINGSELGWVFGLSDLSGFVERGTLTLGLARVMDQFGLLAEMLADRSPGGTSVVWDEHAATWDQGDVLSWFWYLLSGMKHPEQRAPLEAAGCFFASGYASGLSRMRTLSNAAMEGFSIDEITQWWPVINKGDAGVPGTTVARAGIAAGLRCGDWRPWTGTALSLTDKTANNTEMALRITMLERAAAEGWTPEEFATLHEHLPAGEDLLTWVLSWTSAMPSALAASYAAAGFGVAEATRMHVAGADPAPEALVTMAALYGSPAEPA